MIQIWITLTEKICFGDTVLVEINDKNNDNNDNQKEKILEQGIVRYIGYPFDDSDVHYGIDLKHDKGDHNGSIYIDIKSSKVAKKNLKNINKNIKLRKFFKCKSKHGSHGVFVKRECIKQIIHHNKDNKSNKSLPPRFTIDDWVNVQDRGTGIIKFIGNVERRSHLLYGIQLNKKRGKHNGTIGGIQYFKCQARYGYHCRDNHLLLIKTEKYKPQIGGKTKNINVNDDIVKDAGYIKIFPEHFKWKKFFDYYDFDSIEDELGVGEFGVVYKCYSVRLENSDGGDSDYDSDSAYYPDDISSVDSDDSENYVFAVKKIKKAKIHHLEAKYKMKTGKLLRNEIKLLEKVRQLKTMKTNMDIYGGKYVIDLIDVFEDRNYLWIVTNLCSGGSLWSIIEHLVTEITHLRNIMKQILEGIIFLHKHNIAHLDLKPDNILFDQHRNVQFIDFGSARIIPPLHKAGVLTGTPNFIAPEVIQGSYDKQADVWAAGIVFFMLTFGYPPFFEQNNNVIDDIASSNNASGGRKQFEGLFNKIKNGFIPEIKDGLGPWFPSDTTISDNLRQLITVMLEKDLSKRYTSEECLEHKYFDELMSDNKLPFTVMNAFEKFNGQNKFQVLVSTLFVEQIESDQIKKLKNLWNKLDVDNNGTLTLPQFKTGMKQYNHSYKEYQIDAIFESLDWNESKKINFQCLLTAYSYQRLVMVDERFWEIFTKLDTYNDGYITKTEIKKRILAMKKNGDKGKYGMELSQLTTTDWDDNEQIDSDEFLRSLHPKYNQGPVTPTELTTPAVNDPNDPNKANNKFIFPSSVDNIDELKLFDFHEYSHCANTHLINIMDTSDFELKSNFDIDNDKNENKNDVGGIDNHNYNHYNDNSVIRYMLNLAQSNNSFNSTTLDNNDKQKMIQQAKQALMILKRDRNLISNFVNSFNLISKGVAPQFAVKQRQLQQEQRKNKLKKQQQQSMTPALQPNANGLEPKLRDIYDKTNDDNAASNSSGSSPSIDPSPTATNDDNDDSQDNDDLPQGNQPKAVFDKRKISQNLSNVLKNNI